MPGKKIKDKIARSFIALQDSGLTFADIGFPMFCFIISETEDDISFFKEHLFHELDDVNVLPLKTDWEQIGMEVGLFPSRGEARRNNFRGKIAQGWHQVTAGKEMFQKFIFIFKP